jgi:hypothetical protein
MSRRAIALAVLSTAAVVVIAACQDYNLNPVGSCLIQPGSKVVKLDSLSTADILFVVDDSQSMTPKQDALANNFSSFIAALAAVQADRKSHGLDAFDFYIAVTSSSIFDDNSGTPRTTYPTPLASGCSPGPAAAGAPYPNGTFVSATDVTEKVLKFTKDLDWAHYTTDPTIQGLITKFGKNIHVGSCGSNQEQHLEAGKVAIEKVLAGQQPIQAGDFLHANSKLVVVWVGDEDDCSNPISSPIRRTSCNQPGIPPGTGDPGTYPRSRYSSFFSGLGRPFGAGFILSANCSGGTCTPAVCSGGAGGTDAGYRLDALADDFRASGYSVVEDSVCNDFGVTLTAIADLVLPPSVLVLPSVPAASEITMVRIIDSSGNQRKVCDQATTSGQTGTAGWWFVKDSAAADPTPTCDLSNSPSAMVSTPTRCVHINHSSTTNDCEAGAGETYSAEYLGVVPPQGCTSAADCASFLSGDASSYECYRPSGATKSTCLCR